MTEEIPLFPLNTVLFPRGELSLRIFEPRYLSMVSERMKKDKPFGVVLIEQGKESGVAASFHEVGTLAKILDFDQLDDGMLGLGCVGLNKFRVTSHSVQSDQLIIGHVESIAEQENPVEQELLSKHKPVIEFLKQSLNKEEFKPYRDRSNENWDDLSWISFQTAELLPLTADSRQVLLEMNAQERISELGFVLKENGLL